MSDEHQMRQLTTRMDNVELILNGERGKFGLVVMVHILWRSYIWVLCTMSAFGGSLITWAIMRLMER